MRDNYDFSDAVKNPFSGKEKGKFTVKIHYDFNNKENNTKDNNRQELEKEPLYLDGISKTGK